VGFVLAAAGSAIGLGNIWKFPYLAGENGGAVFLILYLGFVFNIGLSVMLAEFAIGRTSEKNPVGAFARLKGGPWTGVVYMGVLTGFIILSFYSVVGGWTIAYALKTATGLLTISYAKPLGDVFGAFVADPIGPVGYHGLFMALTVIVVALFAGWVVYPRAMDADNGGIGDEFCWARVWRFVCRFVAPAAIAWILVSGL
jgi:NSS family neurotransmitter:Na+ symporter